MNKRDNINICKSWDCGWCYCKLINEQKGCIGLEKCKAKHPKEWKIKLLKDK